MYKLNTHQSYRKLRHPTSNKENNTASRDFEHISSLIQNSDSLVDHWHVADRGGEFCESWTQSGSVKLNDGAEIQG
jgi:hypothetical protein